MLKRQPDRQRRGSYMRLETPAELPDNAPLQVGGPAMDSKRHCGVTKQHVPH